MAGVGWNWTKPLAVAALLVCAGPVTFAQLSQTQASLPGSLSGKLTDLYSVPLDRVSVIVRNEATGMEAHTTTSRNGTYRFSGLDSGEYTLVAESPQLGRGQVEGILIAAGHEARVQTAMQFELPPPKPLQIVFHEIPLTQVLPAAVAVAPLQTLPMTARLWQDLGREMPATETPALIAILASMPMKTLTVASQFGQESGLVAPNVIASAQDLRRGDGQPAKSSTGQVLALALVNPTFANAKPASGELELSAISQTLAVGRSLAVSDAVARLVGAAVQFGQLISMRVQPASVGDDPVASAVTTSFTAAELQALPVSGRRWQEFVFDTPTTATPSGGSSQSSMRGAGQETAETTVDGASTRLAFGDTDRSESGSFGRGGTEQNGMGQASEGGRGFAPGESAIRSVEVTAGNVEAKGDRAASGRMNMETQRGGNGLHGQGSIFDRQNTWGARNPFTQWVKETAPATGNSLPIFTPESFTPPDHEITWGIGLGSHIRRNKLYWYAALDVHQRNDPGLSSVKHPDQFFAQPANDQMQVLAARLGLSSVNPVSEGLAAYSKMLETLAGLLGPSPRSANHWVGFGRVDWKVAERHHLTFEGIGGVRDEPGGGMTRVSETYGSHSFGSRKGSEDWLLGRWEAFLTPNLLAVTQASAGRTILTARPQSPSEFEQTLNKNVWGQLPQIVVDSRYGFTIGNPSRFGKGNYPDEHLYEGQESVDWVRGGLQVRAGFSVSHNYDSTSLLHNQTGTYHYSSVENFASDALVFANFGISGELNPTNQRNCDQTGRVWHDSAGNLRGLGYLPCYSYYSQTMGPTNWHLSTNDWAGYATTQWQPKKLLVLSAGLRWELEQLPPPIAALANPELPLTLKLPSLGNNWGPRFSMAVGSAEGRKIGWPVLRVGYGMYFGRTRNATLQTALTQTGSPKGDLNFFTRPTDNLHAGGAPPFPYVFAGEPLSMVKPGAVEFAPNFRNPEIHQAVVAIEETFPGRVQLTASAVLSLGRRLPISIDANLDPSVNPGTITYGVVDGTGSGPIKAAQITVPFYASWPSATSGTGTAGRQNPNYQQVAEIMSRANSTYEAAVVKVTRGGRRGLNLSARYTYAHAMDWNPNESAQVGGSNVLDPADFSSEYGTSNLDVRHSGGATVIYEAPWKLHDLAGRLANGWRLSGIGNFRSGMPYSMRTAGSIAREFNANTGAAIVGLGPGMNGSGGDNRVYVIGRNTYRYPSTWKADLRLGKRFDLRHTRQLELLAESYNLFNHQNVTQLETVGYYIQSGSLSGSLPTLNFLTGLKANTTAFGLPLNINATNYYRERQIQFGMRLRF